MNVDQLKATYQTPPKLFPSLADGTYTIQWRLTVMTTRSVGTTTYPVTHKAVFLRGNAGKVVVMQGHIMLYDGTVHAREVQFYNMSHLFDTLRANCDGDEADMHMTWGAQ